MIKRKLANLYKVMFNYYVKKDGYSSTSHILPSLMVGLTIMFLFLSVMGLISLITGQSFLYHAENGKGLVSIFIAIYFLLIYIMLFYGFKVDKHGSEENHLFFINENTYSRVWLFFFVNTVISFVFIFLAVFFVKP